MDCKQILQLKRKLRYQDPVCVPVCQFLRTFLYSYCLLQKALLSSQISITHCPSIENGDCSRFQKILFRNGKRHFLQLMQLCQIICVKGYPLFYQPFGIGNRFFINRKPCFLYHMFNLRHEIFILHGFRFLYIIAIHFTGPVVSLSGSAASCCSCMNGKVNVLRSNIKLILHQIPCGILTQIGNGG